jgi:hypothetical protein
MLRRWKPVVVQSAASPRRVIAYGETFLHEKLPNGTRVIFPNPPLNPLPDVRAAIRHALWHPLGKEPLPSKLRPGMKVTVAVDDISVPLPPMKPPDVRQLMLEALFELFDQYGVEDVEVIVATAFHRRMSDGEIERMVGKALYRRLSPKQLYNHDAEKPDGMVVIGETRHGEPVELNRRAAESDLIVYLNINLVSMDGGHKSVGVGLTGYKGLLAHHTPDAIRKSDSYFDPEKSAMHASVHRIGRVVNEKLDVFHVETVLNTHMYPAALEFLGRPEETWTDYDLGRFKAFKWTLDRLPPAARREMMMRTPAPYGVVQVTAGATEPVHAKTLERCFEQYGVPVEGGPADVVIVGVPHLCPYNVYSSAMNPLLVRCTGLGYLFNMYRGKPLVRKGGVWIVCHPCRADFDEEHHPSYVEFYHRLLPETRDADVLKERYEREFAENPIYVEKYRFGNAYHGAHPFYMWYWAENGQKHVGHVICAGAEEPETARRLGWHPAKDLATAIEMAKDLLGDRDPSFAMLHCPPLLMAEVP